jgi:hypothetical protein
MRRELTLLQTIILVRRLASLTPLKPANGRLTANQNWIIVVLKSGRPIGAGWPWLLSLALVKNLGRFGSGVSPGSFAIPWQRLPSL